MIEGVVSDAYEAVVALSLQGPVGQAQDISEARRYACLRRPRSL